MNILIHLINHISSETLTIVWMIPLETNSPPLEVSTHVTVMKDNYLSYLVPLE